MEGRNAGGDAEAAGVRHTIFDDLPEGCVVKILSFVTPVDACRSSSVSSFIRSAASSDALWETFLPSDYNSVLSNFAAALPPFSSKKELFRMLCSPIIYDDCKKSFWLDKMTGYKSYMLAARDLSIESDDNPQNWNWIKHDRSRFSEVAELRFVPALDIRGEITTSMMSPDVTYAAYLVYKFHGNAFNCLTVQTSIGVSAVDISAPTICLTPDSEPWHTHRNSSGLLKTRRPKIRKDGWREIELGKYRNSGSKSGESELVSIQVERGQTWGNLIIQGMELRPTIGQETDWTSLSNFPEDGSLFYVKPNIVNGVLIIPQEVVEIGLARLRTTALFGQFVGKPPVHSKIKAMANHLWGREGLIHISKMEGDSPMFLFEFPSEAVSSRVYEDGRPWHCNNVPLIFRRWEQDIKSLKPGEMTVPVRNKPTAANPKPVWVAKKSEKGNPDAQKVAPGKTKDVPECSMVNDQSSTPPKAEPVRDPLKGKAVSYDNEARLTNAEAVNKVAEVSLGNPGKMLVIKEHPSPI